MTRKPRPRPKSPQQIAEDKANRRRLDLEAVGLQPEVADLTSAEAIEVRRLGVNNLAGARRADAFDALKDGMSPGAYDAARRLEADLRLRRGEFDRGPPPIRVDESDDGPCRLDRQLAAGRRVDAALAKIGARDAWLLCELIYPSVEQIGWRETVAHITGETNLVAQGAAVRSACANLAAAYEIRHAA